jgi:hypothetical protein
VTFKRFCGETDSVLFDINPYWLKATPETVIKMDLKKKFLSGIVTPILLIILGCLIYLPVNFLVYEPYFEIEWESAQCHVTGYQTFKLYETVDGDTGEVFWFDYTLYEIAVDSEGRRY